MPEPPQNACTLSIQAPLKHRLSETATSLKQAFADQLWASLLFADIQGTYTDEMSCLFLDWKCVEL